MATETAQSLLERAAQRGHPDIVRDMSTVVGNCQHSLRRRLLKRGSEALNRLPHLCGCVLHLWVSGGRMICTVSASPIALARASGSCRSAITTSHPMSRSWAVFDASRRIARTGMPALAQSRRRRIANLSGSADNYKTFSIASV